MLPLLANYQFFGTQLLNTDDAAVASHTASSGSLRSSMRLVVILQLHQVDVRIVLLNFRTLHDATCTTAERNATQGTLHHVLQPVTKIFKHHEQDIRGYRAKKSSRNFRELNKLCYEDYSSETWNVMLCFWR